MGILTGFVGRALFSLPFLAFGSFHFLNPGSLTGLVPELVPGPAILWVYLIGVALVAGGVGLITRIKGQLAAYLLAVLMLVFVLTIHIPGLPSQQAVQGVVKDLALMGGCLMLAGWFGRDS